MFKDYYKEWLKLNGKYELSSKQQYWYEHSLDLFLKHFGEDIKIKDITRSEYQNLYLITHRVELQKQLEKLIFIYLVVLKMQCMMVISKRSNI